MMALIITLHVIICILLIIIVLIQAGRGGGLVESFSSVESMFGPKTNRFLTRTTTVLAVLFFLSCLGLAVLSARQSRSLMTGVKEEAPVAVQQATDNQAVPSQQTGDNQAAEPSQTQSVDVQEVPKAE